MARQKKSDTAWSQPAQPPPPLFTGEKERNLVKQVNDELIERVIGQQVAYFAVDIDRSNFHPLYGEAIQKTFLPPIRIYALVKWEGQTQSFTQNIGIDKIFGSMNRAIHMTLSGKINNCSNFVFFEETRHQLTITNIPLHEDMTRISFQQL